MEESQLDIETYCGILKNIEKSAIEQEKIKKINELRKSLLQFFSCISWEEWPTFIETFKQIGDYDLFITLKKHEREAE